MNDCNAEDELIARLPARLKSRVVYVFPHLHWRYVEVAFLTPKDDPRPLCVVHIPYEHWLDDWAIARICLEAP